MDGHAANCALGAIDAIVASVIIKRGGIDFRKWDFF